METFSAVALPGATSEADAGTPFLPSSGHRPSEFSCDESIICPGPNPLPEALAARGGAVGAVGGADPGFATEIPAISVVSLLNGLGAITYGGLCFGSLAGALPPDGVTVWLLGSMVAQVAVSAMSGLRFGMGTCAMEALPIMHAIFQDVAMAMPAHEPEEVLATCLATLFVATLCLGILLTVAARFGVARWLRAVPMVVLKGALFGVSIFLLRSGIDSSASPEFYEEVGGRLPAWPHWAASVGLGTAIFILDERTHSAIAVALTLLAVAVAPAALGLLAGPGASAELRAGGWLLPEVPAGASRPWYEQLASVYGEALPRISWRVVLRQAPSMMGFWVTHAMLTLMDLKAIEVLTETEMDLDRELKAVGVGNIVSALCGCGWPVYILCSQNITAYKLGGRTRFVGWAKAALTVPMLCLVQVVVPYLPCALPAGMAWWLGLLFMKETMVDISLQHSSPFDIAIVAAMALIVTVVGLMQGILMGFLLAMWVFTLQYSSLTPVVRLQDTATFLHSNVSRTLAQYAVLERLGHRIEIIHLQGYIMFSSSPQLVDAVRPLLEPGGPTWVVLSFKGVHGLDYSAVCDLAALGRRAAKCGCRLILTETSEGAVARAMNRARLRLPPLAPEEAANGPPGLCHVAHYHPAVKGCEDALLMSMSSISSAPLASSSGAGLAVLERAMLKQTFGDFLADDAGQALDALHACFDRAEYQPGVTLWNAGDAASFCVGVVDGGLHALQPSSSGKGGQPRLMEVVQVGAFVGIMSILNQIPYAQTVCVPDESPPCRVLVLRWGSFESLSEASPKLANTLLRGFLRRGSYEWRLLSRIAAHI